MKIAELLMNIENEFNSHKQTVIKGLTLEQGIQICKELEEYTDNEHSFVIELWTDGSFTISQKDFFSMGNLSGRDKLILSTDG